MIMEEFKPIIGYESYMISNEGNIISTLKYRNNKHIIKPVKDSKGYLRVTLKDNYGKHKTKKVHRLVLLAFLNNPNNFPQCNHKNGIKTDNRIENLEWCDNLYNQRHAKSLGLVPKMIGEKNGSSKLIEKQVIEIRQKFIPRKYTRKHLAEEYSVTEFCIKDIISRKSWNHL